MDQAMVIALGKKALEVTLLLCGPMLGFGLVAGLAVSIIQAVTQIQDMTLTFIPKILAVILALALFSPWMLGLLTDFTVQLLQDIPAWVR
ncbi:MAG: flagellar biosynthesis protein FliQ [Thermodesulfobacteriota bacterium]